MSIIILILLVILFILADVIIRLILKKIKQAKLKKEREAALHVSLKLDYTEEAKSLTRVKIDNPKAKILAVDDEEIILDSLRRILVVGGYSVDTVDSGKEAIGLVRKNDYDFVFTDLKMPEVDGLDVAKAVKHLRPDIDVVIITGYATVESAVDAMKFGVMDYIQKPFTEDELLDFVNKSMIRRQDKIERSIKPAVRLITPSISESDSVHELNVPSGVFIANNHVWLKIELNGLVRLGIDDFILKAVGKVEEIILPQNNKQIKKSDSFFEIKRGNHNLNVFSPINGKIVEVNTKLGNQPEFLNMKPYELGWICTIDPSQLSKDLCDMKIGADSVSWYQDEINKLMKMIKKFGSEKHEDKSIKADQGKTLINPINWESFSKEFLTFSNKTDA